MPHQRKVIRDAIRALLVGQTVADDRVTATRVLPYRRSELPAISIYTLDETVHAESRTTAPRELSRELRLEIAGWVAHGAGMDDAMDALALEIETAMHADPYFGDAAADSILETTTMGVRGEGDSLTGLVTLTYAVTYQSPAPEAPTDLDDFLTAHVTHNLANAVHEDDQAHDHVIVQVVEEEAPPP
jgi:hypothetical protein